MPDSSINGYSLSRKFFDFSFENPERIKPNHVALYFFIIEQCNRLGWKKKFGLPTDMAKEAIGIKSYNTYKNTLVDLVEWGFIEMIERSQNQYSSNIVALSNFDKALDKALDKAMVRQERKQSEITVSIDKQETLEPINKERASRFTPPVLKEVEDYFHLEKGLIKQLATKEAQKFIDHYSSCGWVIGKNKKMKNWKSAASGWFNRMEDFKKSDNPADNIPKEPNEKFEYQNRNSPEMLQKYWKNLRSNGFKNVQIPGSNKKEWMHQDQIERLEFLNIRT